MSSFWMYYMLEVPTALLSCPHLYWLGVLDPVIVLQQIISWTIRSSDIFLSLVLSCTPPLACCILREISWKALGSCLPLVFPVIKWLIAGHGRDRMVEHYVATSCDGCWRLWTCPPPAGSPRASPEYFRDGEKSVVYVSLWRKYQGISRHG